jgi:hypothetical protein
MKTKLRQLGLAMLVHKYGGMVIPNSFVCTRSLKSLYDVGIEDNRAFISESINRTTFNHQSLFLPDLYFFGAERKTDSINELIEYLTLMISNSHFSDESQFSGFVQKWLLTFHKDGYFNLVDGDLIGVKTFKKRHPILIEDLIEEKPIDFSPDCYGVFIDQEEILKRTKYQWFAVMTTDEILASSMYLAKILKKATVDVKSEYTVELSNEKIVYSSDL